MLVKNRTSFPVIAFCWHLKRGYGDDVHIEPDGEAEVKGPYIGEMGGGSCYTHSSGELTCHEAPDDDEGFQVLEGLQLNLGAGDLGICVRHHTEGRKINPPS